MNKGFYFVGGFLGVIAFSNFVGNISRAIPDLKFAAMIMLFVIMIGGFVFASSQDEHEEALMAWFVSLLAIAGGVGIAFI